MISNLINMKTNFEGVEICLVNLARTWEFKYYNVKSSKDLNAAYEDMEREFLADEIEIQGMSHNTDLCENLIDIFKLAEEKEIDLEQAIEIYEAVEDIHEFKSLIENENYLILEGEDKQEAYMLYLDETGYFEGVPAHILNYIDYDAMLRDFEFNGGNLVKLNDCQFIMY